jgi:hypothetical protein
MKNITLKMLMTIGLMMTMTIGLMASQAFDPSGLKTFKQPDGTIFQGYLRGTAAFNWIESNGDLIQYNTDDKYYYKVDIVDSKIIYIEKYLGSTTINQSINRSSSFMKNRDISMQMILEEKTLKMQLGK